MKLKIILVTFICSCATVSGVAHQLITHAAVTLKSYQRSALGANSSLVKNLGIDVLIQQALFSSKYPDGLFGKTYYEIQGSQITPREANIFEARIMGDIGYSTPTDLPSWLMRGAIREDDLGSFASIFEEQASDHGSINRSCNHFFDPLNNIAAAFFLCQSTALRAPEWAIGSTDPFNSPNSENVGRLNRFTIFDARESMYRALTGKTKDGSPAGPGATEATEEIRNAYWATMFRSLGDVLHLNQDMGQPQHTRNESHAGVGGQIGLNFFGNPLFENYVAAWVRGEPVYPTDGSDPVASPSLLFGGYNIPVFDTYSKFWSSGTGVSSLSGTGLADYSNHGFFTWNNNMGDGVYPLPNPSPAGGAYTPDTIQVSVPNSGSLTLSYYKGAVPDFNSSPSDPIKMTKVSAWEGAYSIDQNVIYDQASLLIPRTIAYSAGIINYFFRGSMKIELPDEGVYGLVDHSTITGVDPIGGFKGFDAVKLKITNTSTESMSSGNLTAVLKFRRNNCYTEDLGGYPPFVNKDTCRSTKDEIVVSGPPLIENRPLPDTPANPVTLASNAPPKQFKFSFEKSLPINATDVRLQIVYRGTLGQESDAVVVATQDLSEPTFFSFLNSSDYIHIGSTVKTRDEINANPTLIGLVMPAFLNDAHTQIRPGSLQPFPITMDLKFGTMDRLKIHVENLLVMKFFRVAILSDAEGTTSVLQTSGICHPDRFNIESSVWQDNVDGDGILMTYPEFEKIRNISGWYGASCVQNGDGSAPGADDDRDTAMTIPVASQTPVEVVVNDGSGF